MKVLLAAMRWDYKDPRRGDSFEYWNFWDALRRMEGVEAELFAFDEIESRVGREEMNARLLRRVGEWEPDLVFFVMFTDEFQLETVSQITRRITTVNWFTDDHWRFETYSRHWASNLTWVATTDRVAADSYRRLGFEHVIRTQWACNHYLYRPVEVERTLDVTFVGQPHGGRRTMIERLSNAGAKVHTWGFGWEQGRLTQEEMIEVFSRSKINLNLSNASRTAGWRNVAALFLRRRGPVVVPRRMREVRDHLHELRAKSRDQIKGRNFEIPGCRTFMITSEVGGLEEYFVPDEEMVTFRSLGDLIEKVQYYLAADEEREAIAKAGYERTLRDHTYEKRFREMFRTMGLA